MEAKPVCAVKSRRCHEAFNIRNRCEWSLPGAQNRSVVLFWDLGVAIQIYPVFCLFVFLRVIEQYAHGHIQFMLDFYKNFL